LSKPAKKGIDVEKAIKYLPVLFVGLGVFAFGISWILWFFESKSVIPDTPNLISLVIEVAIGIAITITVYFYSKKDQGKLSGLITKIDTQQTKISDLINNIGQIVQKQEEFTERKQDQAYTGLNGNIFAVMHSVHNLELEFGRFQKEKLVKEEYLEQIKKDLSFVINSLNNLQNYCDAREQYLDEMILNDIHRLLVEGRVYCEMGQKNIESFDPTLVYPELILEIWNKIPDPHEGYGRLKSRYMERIKTS